MRGRVVSYVIAAATRATDLANYENEEKDRGRRKGEGRVERFAAHNAATPRNSHRTGSVAFSHPAGGGERVRSLRVVDRPFPPPPRVLFHFLREDKERRGTFLKFLNSFHRTRFNRGRSNPRINPAAIDTSDSNGAMH